MKLPWFPFYVRDFLDSRKVRRMKAEEVGIYFLFLCEQWTGGPIPDDDETLAVLARSEASVAKGVLKRCFKKTQEGWVNERLEEVRLESQAIHQQRIDAGRRGGLKTQQQRRESSSAKAPLNQAPLEPRSSHVKDSTGTSTSTGTVQEKNEASPSKKKEWDDFAEWFLDAGYLALWGGSYPPHWAPSDWDPVRDLSIVSALHNQGKEPLDVIQKVIEMSAEPLTMQRYYSQQGTRAPWSVAKGEALKAMSLEGKQIGEILKGMED